MSSIYIKKLRIGFNGRPFCQDQIRGLGRHTLELIKHLKSSHPEIEIYIYSYGRVSDLFKKELSFATFRDNKIRPKFLWDLFFLGRDIKKDKINIFHSTNNLGVPFFLFNKTPIFTTIHDTFTHDARIKLGKNPRYWWAGISYRLELFLVKRSNYFFTVSKDAQNSICKKIGIPTGKISVAYNGTDLSLINAPIVLSDHYFLYVGGLEERKNILTLLKAFIIFSGSTPKPYKLKLVGNPQHAPQDVRDLLNKYSNIFILTGNISDQALVQLYQQAEALIFPSIEEGFGLPLVEAMSLNCPVIASDIPVFREIAQNAALYFSPKNIVELKEKLELLAGNLELKNKLTELGKEKSKKFTWIQMSEDIYSIYLKYL